MAKIGEKELKQHIKNKEFSNAYFIYGEESYLKEFYVNKLKEIIVEPAFADFNFHQYNGKDTSRYIKRCRNAAYDEQLRVYSRV